MSHELTEFAEGFVQGCHNKGMTFDEMQKSAALASENIPGVADDLACLLTKEAGADDILKLVTEGIPAGIKKVKGFFGDAASKATKVVDDVPVKPVKNIVSDAVESIPQATARTVPGGGAPLDYLNPSKQQWRNAAQTEQYLDLKRQLDALHPGATGLRSELTKQIANLPPSAKVFRDRLTKELADINKRGHGGVFNATDAARRLDIQKQLHNMPAPLKSPPPIKLKPVPHLTRAQITQELADINKRGFRGNLNEVDRARRLELQKQMHKFTPRSHPTFPPVRPPNPELTAAAQQQIKVLERELSKATNPSIRKGMLDQINKLKNQFDPVMMDAVKQFDLNEAARLKATSPKPPPPMLKGAGYDDILNLGRKIPGWLKKLTGGVDDVASKATKVVDDVPVQNIVGDAAENIPQATARTVPGGGAPLDYLDDILDPQMLAQQRRALESAAADTPSLFSATNPSPLPPAVRSVGRAITNPGYGALAGAGGDYAVQTFGDATGLYDYDDYYLTGLGALTGGARMFPNTRLGSRATRAIDWARAPSAAAKDKGFIKRWASSPEGRVDLATLLVDAGAVAAHTAVGGDREQFRNEAKINDTARRYLSDPGYPVADSQNELLQVAEAEIARNKELDRLVTIGEITPEERGQYEALFQNEYQQEVARRNPSAPPMLDTVSPQTVRTPAEVPPIDTSADTISVSTPVDEPGPPTEERGMPDESGMPGTSQARREQDASRDARREEDLSGLDTPIALEPNVDPNAVSGPGYKIKGQHYGITNGVKRWWNNLGTKGQVGAVMGVLGLLGGPLLGSRGNTGLGMGSSALGGLLLADLMGLFGEPGQYSNMIAQKIGIGDLGIKAKDPDIVAGSRYAGPGGESDPYVAIANPEGGLSSVPADGEDMIWETDSEAPAETEEAPAPTEEAPAETDEAPADGPAPEAPTNSGGILGDTNNNGKIDPTEATAMFASDDMKAQLLALPIAEQNALMRKLPKANRDSIKDMVTYWDAVSYDTLLEDHGLTKEQADAIKAAYLHNPWETVS